VTEIPQQSEARSHADGVAKRSAVADQVLGAARRMFMGTGTIEMQALARRLGIGRATLYRWRRDREALLSEVILSLGVANLLRCDAETELPPGPERFCVVHNLHLQRITSSLPLRAFVQTEPDLARRVLLDAEGTVHVGIARALADYVRGQEDASGWNAPLPADVLGSMLSRVSEVFLYSDLIANAEPDVTTPDVILRLMLGRPVSPQLGYRPAGGASLRRIT
jgi:AcrR family transcriptional regulator